MVTAGVSLGSCSGVGEGKKTKRSKAADKCGWKEAVSIIVTINHPGPLWSCPVNGASAGRQTGSETEEERKRQRKRGREGAGWLQGERRGKNGWGSACMSTSAPAAGLGSSAAVSVHVLRVLPDPGP